eukprot:11209543-Lingulodinium_polyedra.AAC.1
MCQRGGLRAPQPRMTPRPGGRGLFGAHHAGSQGIARRHCLAAVVAGRRRGSRRRRPGRAPRWVCRRRHGWRA